MTASGTTSKTVAEKFSFEFCTADKADILCNQNINTVFISTRHNSHAEFVRGALENNKHVFVEKPLCLKPEEVDIIEEAVTGSSHLMVGFNRRFAPLVLTLKDKLNTTPMSMLYRVNAGFIPAESWIQDTAIGGGRILGEVCHFIDFMAYMCGSLPTTIYASMLPDPKGLNDTVNVNIDFKDGSIGTVAYYANGAKSLAKEYIEIYSSGTTAIIRDYKELEIHTSGKPFRKKLIAQDKGQKQMLFNFFQAIKTGGDPTISHAEIFAVTRATFSVLESLRQRKAISLEA